MNQNETVIDPKSAEPAGVSAPEIKAKVRAFITKNFYIPASRKLADDTSLLDSGLVDSTSVLEIVAFLQTDFGVDVPDKDLVPENLDSIDRLTAYIVRMGGRPAAI